MEEKQITPEEAFFSAKANLELAITFPVSDTYGCTSTQPLKITDVQNLAANSFSCAVIASSKLALALKKASSGLERRTRWLDEDSNSSKKEEGELK